MIRINPTKMLVGGDTKAAKTFLGPARSQLEILKQDMSFQNLSQGVRKVWLNSDVYVECRKIFNYQECKVWVRPIIALEETGVYFYIHIVKPNIGSNEGEDINRLILWRHREEEKTVAGAELSKPEIDYEDYGEYIDGRKWGITTLGAVILDVDLASNTVYTESGEDEDGNPIEVDTTLTEAAQIEMAQKYMDVIYPTNPAVDAFIPAYAETGNIYSPFQSAKACETGENTIFNDEVYFNETLDVDLGGGVIEGFYHVREEVTDDPVFYSTIKSFEGPNINHVPLDAGVDPTPWCNNPKSKYNSLDWIKIDDNASKYIPSTETLGNAGYYNCGGSCFSNLNCPYSYHSMSRFPCHTEVSYQKGEHYDGHYFIDLNHASFFVTIIGNHQTNSQIRKAVLNGYGWEHSSWPDQENLSGLSSASVSIGSGFNALSTPLEKSVPFNVLTWVPDDFPGCQKSFYQWAGTRRTASITVSIAQDYTIDPDTEEVDQFVHHHPASWWAGFPAVSGLSSYPADDCWHPNKAIISFIELDDPVFYSTIRFFEGPNINHVPLVAYYEQNHRGRIGHCFANRFDGNSEIAWYYNQWPSNADIGYDSSIFNHPNCVGSNASSLPTIDTFQVAIVFNLMQIESFTGIDNEGNTTYWDIHTEREFDQDDNTVEIADKRDNHNREKLLSAYVSAALKDIKQLPDMQKVDGTYKFLSNCGLKILTGYVYQ